MAGKRPDEIKTFGRAVWGRYTPVERPELTDLDASLLEAVRANRAAEVRMLLQFGANQNAQDEEGMTCLHHAAARGTRASLRVLVGDKHTNYLIPDDRGRFPSDLAIQWSRDFAVARLLTRKRLRQAHALNVDHRPAVPVPLSPDLSV